MLLDLSKHQLSVLSDLIPAKAILTAEDIVVYPLSYSVNFIGHQSYRGRRKYKCNSCSKAFNVSSDTAISCIKESIDFKYNMGLIRKGMIISKMAKIQGISSSIAFAWGHKVLASIGTFNGSTFNGLVNCDEEVDINKKGDRELAWKPLKRHLDRDSKPECNDKLTIVLASDQNAVRPMRLTKLGRIDADSFEKSGSPFVSKVCSNAYAGITVWVKSRQLEHPSFVAKNTHIKNKSYHILNVNSMAKLYERWMKRFCEVSTEYLQQYLNWLMFLQRTKKTANAPYELARTFLLNSKAFKTYGKIKEFYSELYPP